MKIWKFPLQVVDCQRITAPRGIKPLCVQMQNGIPCLWAVVDQRKDTVEHEVWIHGTGHDVSPAVVDHYVGTFQMMNGAVVFHVFCKTTI